MSKSVPRYERIILPRFGAYLKSLRKKIKPADKRKILPRRIFARMLGYSPQLIGEYERGTCYDPSPDVLKKISEVTSTPFIEILLVLVEEKYLPGKGEHYVVLLHEENRGLWDAFGLIKLDQELADASKQKNS